MQFENLAQNVINVFAVGGGCYACYNVVNGWFAKRPSAEALNMLREIDKGSAPRGLTIALATHGHGLYAPAILPTGVTDGLKPCDSTVMMALATELVEKGHLAAFKADGCLRTFRRV